MRKYNKYENGMKFGKLTLIERTESPRIWKCQCECGELVYTQISQGSRECRKCAYERISIERTVHGESSNKSRLYNIWIGVRTRCSNNNRPDYKYYGGRGIKVCQEWNEYANFKKWAEESGYAEGLEIERKNVDGNYESDNCKWITRREQMRNTRKNRRIEIDGHVLNFIEWLELIEIKKSNAYKNAKKQNMTIEEYLTKKYYDRNVSEKLKKREETNHT